MYLIKYGLVGLFVSIVVMIIHGALSSSGPKLNKSLGIFELSFGIALLLILGPVFLFGYFISGNLITEYGHFAFLSTPILLILAGILYIKTSKKAVYINLALIIILGLIFFIDNPYY